MVHKQMNTRVLFSMLCVAAIAAASATAQESNRPISATGAVSVAGAEAREKPARKSNVVFILADDLGYMDVAAYAARVRGVDRTVCFYETPNIDALGDRGVSFMQAYACQLCAPTRASLLTGKYAARQGFTSATPRNVKTWHNTDQETPEDAHPLDMIVDNQPPSHPLVNASTRIGLASGGIPEETDQITIAEGLEEYHSAFIGKWHVGAHGLEGYQPRNQGFHEIAYFDAGASPYYTTNLKHR